jgi:hypothetical protein
MDENVIRICQLSSFWMERMLIMSDNQLEVADYEK